MTWSRAKRSAAVLLALVVLGTGGAMAAAQSLDPPEAPARAPAADQAQVQEKVQEQTHAQAQGEAVRVPSGQGESGPPAQRAQSDKAGADKDEDLERARAAARAADPRLEGLEKAREAARKTQDQGGARDCMSAREARNAILAKKAVTLSQALRAARAAWEGEVIDYKLCVFDGVLAYDLTLLNGDGRVGRVRVGAADGKLVNVR